MNTAAPFDVHWPQALTLKAVNTIIHACKCLIYSCITENSKYMIFSSGVSMHKPPLGGLNIWLWSSTLIKIISWWYLGLILLILVLSLSYLGLALSRPVNRPFHSFISPWIRMYQIKMLHSGIYLNVNSITKMNIPFHKLQGKQV